MERAAVAAMSLKGGGVRFKALYPDGFWSICATILHLEELPPASFFCLRARGASGEFGFEAGSWESTSSVLKLEAPKAQGLPSDTCSSQVMKLHS